MGACEREIQKETRFCGDTLPFEHSESYLQIIFEAVFDEWFEINFSDFVKAQGIEPEDTGKHGFDLTDFSEGGFQKVLAIAGIEETSVRWQGYTPGYVWRGADVMIKTSNNPITGLYRYRGKECGKRIMQAISTFAGEAK